MGLKLRWFRARMNFAHRPQKTVDFSAPSHGLYRPTYSVYEADTVTVMSRSTKDISQPNMASTMPPKQMSKSMPDLGDNPSQPLSISAPKVRTPHIQHNTSSLHNPFAQRDIAAAINPAFAHEAFNTAAQDTAKTKNKLQLKINIPASSENHVSSEPPMTVSTSNSKPGKNKPKNKLAPTPPKQTSDKKNKKGSKEVIDLRFGGESES